MRPQSAERDANDRYAAAFLQDRIGGIFEGRISGVTRYGLFVRLADSGADGIDGGEKPAVPSGAGCRYS